MILAVCYLCAGARLHSDSCTDPASQRTPALSASLSDYQIFRHPCPLLICFVVPACPCRSTAAVEIRRADAVRTCLGVLSRMATPEYIA